MIIEPSRFWTVACPTYGEIRLALGCAAAVRRLLDEEAPDAIHIATEGPIGWAARNWCLKRGRQFTTSFHTRFPDYVSARSGVPSSWGWAVMRRFHGPAVRTFAVTPTLASELETRGIAGTYHWPLGVDLGQFNCAVRPHSALADLSRPILLSVGRVAPEKNLEAFLDLDVAGSKVVVGDGPDLNKLKALYPEVLFLGARHGEELASSTERPTSSSFRAGRTHSAWSISKRLPAGCQSPLFQFPAQPTSWGPTREAVTAARPASVLSIRISAERLSGPWPPTVGLRQPKRPITTGSAVPPCSLRASRCRPPKNWVGERRN